MKKKLSTYADGYIYYFFNRENKLIYIGSSRQNFKKRINDHKTDFKGYFGLLKTHRNYRASFDIMIQEDYEVGILEYYPCDSKEELEIREGEWILAFKEKKFNVVNKHIPSIDSKLTLPSSFYPIPF
jgi:predicted GIY-YIG superfamily endonuclease